MAEARKHGEAAANSTSLPTAEPIVAALDRIANSSGSLCLQLEACRKLKGELIEEAKSRYPFKEHREADVTVEKVQKYRELWERLERVYREEIALWGKWTS